MINRNEWVDDFQKNISDLIGRSPAADIERNVRAFMTQTFSRLDLVTREEFDIQAQLLEKALHRITALESRLNQLEGRHQPASGPATPSEPIHSSAADEPAVRVEPVTPVNPSAPAQPASAIELPPSVKRRDHS